MKIPLGLLAGCVMLMLAGCQNAGPPPLPTQMALTEHDIGKTVTLADNATLTLTLPTNPTTGYQWSQPMVQNTQAVAFISSNYTAPDSTAMGAGGTTTFLFQTRGPGVTAIRLTYARPFAPQDNPSYFTFYVMVRHVLRKD